LEQGIKKYGKKKQHRVKGGYQCETTKGRSIDAVLLVLWLTTTFHHAETGLQPKFFVWNLWLIDLWVI
jgi:hypothetical protein